MMFFYYALVHPPKNQPTARNLGLAKLQMLLDSTEHSGILAPGNINITCDPAFATL